MGGCRIVKVLESGVKGVGEAEGWREEENDSSMGEVIGERLAGQ